MSNDMVKAGQNYLVKSNDESLRKDAGKALVTVGGGGIVLGGLAAFLPFITLPMLLVALVVFGGYLWFK